MSSLASETVLFRASRRHRPSVSVRQIPSCADVRCASAHWAVRSSSHRIGWHLGLVGLALLRSGAGTPRAPDPPAAPPMAAATAPEPGWTEATIAELMTSEHNRARAQVRWGAAAPPGLTWSTSLAGLARDWANQRAQRCEGLQHLGPTQHGQNLPARASIGSGSRFSPSEVVAGWMAEAPCWTPGRFGATDRCDKACVGKLNSTGCGHYTQVVWRNTRDLGCGYRPANATAFWSCSGPVATRHQATSEVRSRIERASTRLVRAA
jgi:hypothetical protein